MAYGNFNYTHGRFESASGKVPLDHIAPIYGKIGLQYNFRKWNLDVFTLYNGKKSLQDYSPSGEDNLQYAPANGMPAWNTYNFKSSYTISSIWILYSGFENILDIQYRTFGSGINAAGRNFYLGGKFSL